MSTYDLILCFTRTDAARLRDTPSISSLPSERRARILLLPGCNAISSEDCAKDVGKTGDLISRIKKATKRFIAEELGDWTDGMERTKTYRTLQLLLPGRDSNFAGASEALTDEGKLRELESQTGCSIHISRHQDSTKEILVSVVGPKERLAEAAALLRPDTEANTDIN